jgi:hypothetical protein
MHSLPGSAACYMPTCSAPLAVGHEIYVGDTIVRLGEKRTTNERCPSPSSIPTEGHNRQGMSASGIRFRMCLRWIGAFARSQEHPAASVVQTISTGGRGACCAGSGTHPWVCFFTLTACVRAPHWREITFPAIFGPSRPPESGRKYSDIATSGLLPTIWP